MSKHLFATLFLVCVSQVASGGILFTIEGTAQSTALGFTAGQPVQLTMLLDDFGSATPTGTADGSRLYWEDEQSGDPNMWSNVTVTGQTGHYQVPTGDDAYNFIEVTPGAIYLWASTTGASLGFSLGGEPVNEVQSYVVLTGANFPMPLIPPDPNAYFASLVGTYTSFEPGGSTYLGFPAAADFGIDVTSFTIAQVPEPSAAVHAGLAGFAGLLLAISRHVRRR